MRDCNTEATGMKLKERGREMEMQDHRERRMNMQGNGKGKEGWTTGLFIDIINQEIITRVTE